MYVPAQCDVQIEQVDQAGLMALVDAVSKGNFSFRLVGSNEVLPPSIGSQIQKNILWQSLISSKMVTLNDENISATVLTWNSMIAGVHFFLEKWDSCMAVHLDSYRLFAADWMVSFVWDCSGFVGDGPKESVQALNNWGRVRNLEISNFEAFKRDWALAIMFAGHPSHE